MTPILTALKALAVARSSEADESVLAVYLHNLEDLDADAVCTACERLGKLPRAAYQAALPEVGIIRAEAAKVVREEREQAAVRKLAPAPEQSDPRTWVHCLDCEDTSWRPLRCAGGGARGDRDPQLPLYSCGYQRLHSAHSYVERCRCYDTNPVIAHRRHKNASAA